MKLTPIVLLVMALPDCFMESRTIGHHPLGVGHHPPGEGHHARGEGHHRHSHHHRDHDGDDDDDNDDDDGNDGRKHRHSFYMFGDSFADNGNHPHWDEQWPALSRQWYSPYGGNGRFSNKMVESDFIADILGLSKAPPAHVLGSHPNRGINFAVGGSGIFKVPQDKPTLSEQIDSFFSLILKGSIEREHLERKSVALIAISGNDYARVGADTSGFSDITTYVDKVTSQIVAGVQQLQDIGVQKVLVNNLYPLGCAPSLSKPSNYTKCGEQGNQGASLHNSYLKAKLGHMDDVLILDLNSVFTEILNHTDSDDDEEVQNFVHKRNPCCESFEPSGFCGIRTQENHDIDNPVVITRYKVCNNADSYFFWDEMHPTQAGWAAIMGQLQRPIKEFLEIE